MLGSYQQPAEVPIAGVVMTPAYLSNDYLRRKINLN